jgi:hypothetical protein
MYDIIGDIHGHADRLIELLEKMGYSAQSGTYSHPKRRAVFVGDYIDRGPQIPEALQIIKSMADSGNAIALMGNHEYNAICFHIEKKSGGHLRKHSIKNIMQHYETLRQFHQKQDDYIAYIDWFKTLPLYYENDYFRVVHACWEKEHIEFLDSKLTENRLDEVHFGEASNKQNKLYEIVEVVLKGKEIPLPPDYAFLDKDKNQRSEMRIKWWENPITTNVRDLSVIEMLDLPKRLIDRSQMKSLSYYSADEKPVFFGHYWLSGAPVLYRHNICCLDYSVAKKGLLVAYQYDGETTLKNDNFVFV